MYSYDYLFKYIIVGDSGVGKSCLLSQFTNHRFETTHDITIGVEFGSKIVTIDNKHIKLHIWDTAGQESFKSITRSYYRGSVGVLVVYDVTRRETFDHVQQWYNDVKKEVDNPNLVIILIGNKSDLQYRREVTTIEALQYAKKHGFLFCETSAKTSDNVKHAFEITTRIIFDKIVDGVLSPSTFSGVKLGVKTPTENYKNCCTII